MTRRSIEVFTSFTLVLWAATSALGSAAATEGQEPWVGEIQPPHYFALYVEDVDRAVEWYRTVLGLRELGGSEAEDGSWRIENLGNDELLVEIIRHPRAAAAERALGFAKVGFHVADVEEVARRADQTTGERSRIVDFEALGQRILQLRDPEGNVVQVVSRLGESGGRDARAEKSDPGGTVANRSETGGGAANGSAGDGGAAAGSDTLDRAAGGQSAAERAPRPTMGSVLEASAPSDWTPLAPENTLYMKLPAGRVVIRLAPGFAPLHVANVKALVEERYFDGLAVMRSQENYVVQWGDPATEASDRRPHGKAKPALPAEFDRAIVPGEAVTPVPDGDVYAPEAGFADAFPVALDRERGRIWLAHCNGMLGVGRDVDPGSGSGAELYVVIGHSPRHLDRNVTLVGRVVEGMGALSTLPRGSGPLGFYEDAAQHVEIESIRLGVDLPPEERAQLEILRTDTATFEQLIEARRNRHESWFVEPTGRVSLCNVPLPVRRVADGAAGG